MSWEPLASSDPVPGDPGRVAAVADQLAQMADAIGEQTGRLRGVTAEAFWEGDAADRFEADKDDLPPLLDLVQRRYGEVGSALARYAPELAAAQELARRALAQARNAEADISSAERGIDRMDEYARDERARVRSMAAAYPDRPSPRPVPWSGPNYHVLLGDAQADLAAARALLDQAVDQNVRAAQAAARTIHDAIHDDIRNTFRSRAEAAGDFAGDVVDVLHESWDETLAQLSEGARWLTEHLPLERLSHILGVIAAVAGTVSLILTLTGVGAPVAAFLSSVALAASAAKLAIDVVIWAADDFSAEKGIQVVISAVMLAAGLGMTSLGSTARSFGQSASNADDFARAARFASDVEFFDRAGTVLDAAGSASDLLELPEEVEGVVAPIPTRSLLPGEAHRHRVLTGARASRPHIAPISPFAPAAP